MKIKINSKTEKANQVLEKLSKKKQRGILITGHYNDQKLFVAIFEFNKMISKVMSGLGKYVLPQQKEFINDFFSKEGLTKKDYEVIIE